MRLSMALVFGCDGLRHCMSFSFCMTYDIFCDRLGAVVRDLFFDGSIASTRMVDMSLPASRGAPKRSENWAGKSVMPPH